VGNPPDKPSSRAKQVVHHPGAISDPSEIVVPPPHIREDANERGYMGTFQDSKEAAETQTQYVRLPVDIMRLVYQIVNDPQEVYGGNAAAFFRHAAYELIYAHYERRLGKRNAPQIVQYLRQVELAREHAWEMHAVRGLKDFIRGFTMFLAQAIEHRNSMDVHRKLDGLATLMQKSKSDTWTAEFKGLIRHDSTIRAAVNFLTREWTDSEDRWKRKQQERWSAWLQGLEEV